MYCLRLRTVAQYGVVNVSEPLHICEIDGLENTLPSPIEMGGLSEFCKDGCNGRESSRSIEITNEVKRREFRI